MYIITTPYKSVTRRRKDSAEFEARKACYDALAAQGQLDTRAGHAVMRAVNDLAAGIASGAYSLIDFSMPLPHGGLIKIVKE